MRGTWNAAVLVLAAASLCLGQNVPAPSSQAPEGTGPRAAGVPGAGPRRTLESQSELKRLTMALGLNPDQREKLRPVITDEGDQLSAVRLDEHLTPEKKKARLQEIRDSFNPKITAILTPEQQEKWKKMQEAPQSQGQPATSGTPAKQ